MNEDPNTRPGTPPDGTDVPNTDAETFLERTKQAVLSAIEETIRRHGSGLLADVRQTLQGAVEGLVAAQVEKMVEQLKPGGDTARRLTEGWLRELREFADTTLGDLFDKRVPEYSRRAGQWVIDYALAGSLFAIAAVLLFVGGILALHELGVPAYAATLACGVVALGLGYWLLRTRSRRPAAPETTASGQKTPG